MLARRVPHAAARIKAIGTNSDCLCVHFHFPNVFMVFPPLHEFIKRPLLPSRLHLNGWAMARNAATWPIWSGGMDNLGLMVLAVECIRSGGETSSPQAITSHLRNTRAGSRCG